MAAPPDDATQHALTALLAEHASLRQESVQAIANRIAVMNFTFGALAVVIAALLAGAVDRTVAGLIALLFVPQMAKAGLLIWLGEYNRSMRAGAWLARIESQVNRLIGTDGTLTWETSLISRSSHMDYPYVATAAFILGAGYLGSLLGVFYVTAAVPGGTGAHIGGAAALLAYVGAIETAFARFFWSRWRDTRLNPLSAHVLPERPRPPAGPQPPGADTGADPIA
ncbi:MAG TPA: hypothetical protein VGL93_32425 [Streptosporangiaceae bacterium]|jgi:hypothetical protein